MNSIWKDRYFVWFLSGQTMAQFGAAIAMFTIPWLLLQQTGSAADTGLAFAIGFIPYLILSLPAGAWADRMSRSKMMIGADLGRLVIMAAIPVSYLISGETPVLLLIAVQFGLSAFAALFDAAYGAYLPLIVPKEKLGGANSALQSGTSFSQILGPALGGTLLAWLGGGEVLILTAATYLISIVTIMKVRKHEQQQPAPTQKRRLLQEIGEGFAYVWSHRLIRTTGIFSMLANFAVPATGLALLYRLQTEMQLSSDTSGLILSGLSVGMVSGSLLYGQLKKRLPMKLLLAAPLVGMLMAPVILALSSNMILMAAAYWLSGLAIGVWNVTLITLRQTSIAPALMGRAMSSMRLIAFCSLPAGNILGGNILQTYNSTSVFVVGIAIHLIMLFLSFFLFQQMGEPGTRLEKNAAISSAVR